MTDDAELLDRYIGDRSEAAFAELVERHIGIVYHAALRQLGGDVDQAKDISQLVFVLLKRHRRFEGILALRDGFMLRRIGR